MNKSIIALFGMFLAVSVVAAEPLKHLPMPPEFGPDTSSEKILAAYPLGVITKLAAFAHHGQAIRKVTLVNGMEGWVYEVHTVGDTKGYVKHDGTEVQVNEIGNHPAMATYTLVFDHGGTVVDVLYTEAERAALQSALLVQRQQHGDKARADEVPGENK
jgi:hypothetical protein